VPARIATGGIGGGIMLVGDILKCTTIIIIISHHSGCFKFHHKKPKAYPIIPDRPCIICIIRRSRARKISSFFFLSEGGFASDTFYGSENESFRFDLAQRTA